MTDWRNRLSEAMSELKRTVFGSADSAREEAELILARLRSIDEAPPEADAKKFVTALEHLATSKGDEGDDFHRSLDAFKALSSKAGSSARVLGDYGLTLAALASEDRRRAAITAYRSTEANPAAASQAFPPGFYNSDFREILLRSSKELRRTVKALNEATRVNRSKRFWSSPTFVIRSLVVSPVNYLIAASSAALPSAPDVQVGHVRSRSYGGKVRSAFDQRMKDFDRSASDAGLTIGANEQQKEEMLRDQVRRLTSIYQNHLLATTQEAKMKRRELEAGTDADEI